MKREGGWGFLLRLLCPSSRFLQLLLTSSNSPSEWNLQQLTSSHLTKQPQTHQKRQKSRNPPPHTRKFITYLLHCWQNRCCFPPTNTIGVLECFSQTLWRLWYSLQLLRSELHPSTEHVIFCDPFCIRVLFDDPEDDVFESLESLLVSAADFSTKSKVSPSLKSTEAPPFFGPSKPPFDCSNPGGSHPNSFQSKSIATIYFYTLFVYVLSKIPFKPAKHFHKNQNLYPLF